MKKYVIISVVLCLLAAIGVAVYFLIPKVPSEAELVVNASDARVHVDAAEKIDYTVSIKDALVSFEIEDKSVAMVKASEEGVEIVGVAVGVTKLTLTASYKSKTYSTIVTVVVFEGEPPKEDGESPKDEPSQENPDGNGGGEGGDEGGSAPSEPIIKPNVTFPKENLINCEVIENVIIVSCSVKAVFTISSDVDLSMAVGVVGVSDKIEVAKEKLIGNNTFSVVANEVGEYQITIVLEGKYDYSYTVRVIE